LNSGTLRERIWVPLERTATQLWVLEWIQDVFNNGSVFQNVSPRLTRYTDEGQAVP